MIISASRRTDIPAFYGDWFIKRLQEEYVMVRNPVNPKRVSRVSLKKDDVDCIVFWTKNPERMIPLLGNLNGYTYYFQFTLNPYDESIEPGVPDKKHVTGIFKRLSDTIGPHRVVWRYDPVLMSPSIDAYYHKREFGAVARELSDYTEKCIISFIDRYRKINKNLKALGIHEAEDEVKREIGAAFSRIAGIYGLRLETCAEEIDLGDIGIGHARCIDPELIEMLMGKKMVFKKDANQRKACGCVKSIDIGAYNTCVHGCIYCYANSSKASGNGYPVDLLNPLL